MKLLAICSALDLKYRYGCIPAWWQLLKGLYELGVDVIATAYQGEAIESPWWRVYPNPCLYEVSFFASIKRMLKNRSGSNQQDYKPQQKVNAPPQNLINKISNALIPSLIGSKWEKHVRHIIENERNVDAVIVFDVLINYLAGLPTQIKSSYNVPFFFYDSDVPWSLPQFADNLSRKVYQDTNLSEYDGFISNSEGGAPELLKLGAKKVKPIFWGVDPSLYAPVDTVQDIAVFFYGVGYRYRKEWIELMLTEPSRKMPKHRFVLGGRDYEGLDLGETEHVENVPLNVFRQFCCRSKINLNIPRTTHASIYASSSCRLFELASLGCCIVSRPQNGLERWFEVGKEILVVHNLEEALHTYKELLSQPKLRKSMGKMARKRVLAEHTARHRAKELLDFVRS